MQRGLVWVAMTVIGAGAGCGGCDDEGGAAFDFADAGAWTDAPEVSAAVTLRLILAAAQADAPVTITITPETDGEVVVVHESTEPGDPYTWHLAPERRYLLVASAPGHQSISHTVTTGDGGTSIHLGTFVLTQGLRLGGAQYVFQGGGSDVYDAPQVIDPATGTMIVGTAEAWLRIRDPGSGPLEITELEDLPVFGATPQFSPDGSTLFLSTYDEGLIAYDTTTWTRFAGAVGGLDTSRLVFAGDGTKIAAGGVVFSWDNQTLTTLVVAGDQYDTLSGDGHYLGYYDGANQEIYDTTTGTLYTQMTAQGSLALSNDGAHIIHARNGSGAFCPGVFDRLLPLGCTVAIDFQSIGNNIRLFAVSPTVPAAIGVVNFSPGLANTVLRVGFGTSTTVSTVGSSSMSNVFTRAAAVGDLVVVQDDVIRKDPDTSNAVPHAPSAHAIDIRTGVVGAEIPGQFTLHPRSDGSIALLEVFCDEGGDNVCVCPLADLGDCARRLVIIAPDGTVAETIQLTEDIPFGPDRSQSLTLDSWGHYFPGAAVEQEAWIVATPATGARRTIAHTTGLGVFGQEYFGPVTGETSPRILDAPCLVYARDEQALPPFAVTSRGVYCVR